MSLTESQREAVQKVGKNILVSAGAGTGKTHVLVERVLYLLKTQKAQITELLVLTFTEKAANEIKGRLFKELRELRMEQPRRDLEKSSISTFHSFASRLLKEHPIEAGVDPDYRVIEAEQSELLKEEVLRETLKRVHEEKNEAFELLAMMGEGPVWDGILKVFTAARHEGKPLEVFFLENKKKREETCAQKEKEIPRRAQTLIRKLEEIDGNAWERFLSDRDWDWKTVRDFQEWSELYGAGRKVGWKEWRGILEDLKALRVESLAMPWRDKFECLALRFEQLYDAKKKEEGFLDFDDLQMKAVGLFSGEKAMNRKLRERYQKQFKFILIDEFQDTNFLQTRFAELLSSGNDLFMVGDYKQSIYGFRGAEPRIFLEKETLYAKDMGGERLVLFKSFRSEPKVVDFINDFFKMLWAEDDFPFEPLRPEKKQTTEGPAVEILVTEAREGEEKEHSRMREARAMALRIRELHEQKKVPYGDIAMLFQAMTVSGIYEDALKAAGIPYFVVAGRGFYEQPEIQDMMSFLAHLEKPLADIPLAATLRSPFFHITDDTLFWLSHYAKGTDEKAPLCHSLEKLDPIREIAAEQQKQIHFFVALTREFRGLKDRVPIADLIDKILERTGYELSVLADPQGVRRFANLKKLIALVREYEAYERVPLAVLLNILKRLKTQEVRESEAPIALETGAEAVRIMSVHAAKGLQFGTVFVADMGHQGNYGGSKAVLAHAADGYSMRVRNEESQEMEEPYFYGVLGQNIKKREDEEWKRLFYVAVTRAKSRVFLSGVYQKKKKAQELFSDMSSWMDWAMAVGEGLKIPVTFNADEMVPAPSRRPPILREKIARILDEIARQPSLTPGLDTRPRHPVPQTGGTAPKVIDLPVSAYVLFQKDPEAFWRVYQIGWRVGESDWPDEEPRDKEEVSAADFGTAMHSFFERLDFKCPENYLKSEFLERIFGAFGKEPLAEARELIGAFIQSPVFKRLQRAKRIEREIDFVLNERHGLIHGKIDVLFQDENDAWHILDYKTASGDEEKARQSAYDLQLEVYALAAQKILKIPVRSGIIYYLKNQKSVTLSFCQAAGGDFLDKLEKKIGALQKKLLDYSNQKMAACGKEPS